MKTGWGAETARAGLDAWRPRRRRTTGERMGRSPEESFQLADDDTVTSAKAAHWQACAMARAAVADHSLDAVVTGHCAEPRTLHWV